MNKFEEKTSQLFVGSVVQEEDKIEDEIKAHTQLLVRNKSEKRLVDRNIPPLGGVATAIAFFIGVSFLGEADYNFALIGLFAILLSLVGAVDDFFNLEWRIKLFFQILFVTIPIFNLNIFLNIETLFNLDLNNVLNYLGSI